MNQSSTYTPPIWRTAALIVFAAALALADLWLVAWFFGSVWAMAAAAGTIVGLIVSIAWTLRHYRRGASSAGLVVAALLIGLLAGSSWRAGGLGVGVALAVFGAWFLAYDVWFTGRANTEFPTPVTTLGGDRRNGRALIVHHQGRGPMHFQARLQRALADALYAQGWRVDLTTASHETPTDVSRYDLLVLGAQVYNWCPARPIVDYLDRVSDLEGMPVVLVVSGGGMTERAMRVLQTQVVHAGGLIVGAAEVWTSRPDQRHEGSSDPEGLMRRLAAHLTPPLRKSA